MTAARELLTQYASKRDAEAFAVLARDHAEMVFATCYRILGNAADAEEVAQECFVELAHQAAEVRGMVGSWLHGVATHKAIDALRARKRRRDHETQAQRLRHDKPTRPTWIEVAPAIDEAIEALPPQLRDAIVLHYLQGQTQAEIATRFGTSQPTISRHLEQAVDAVRKQLRRVVLLTGSIALAGMLSSQTAQAAAARDDFDIGEWNAEEDLAAYLDLMEECMRILRQPLAKQLGEVQNLTAKIKTIPESCVATRTVLPALGRFVEEHLARQARLHNTLAALAVERYRLKHKKLPEKLDDLVPEFLHAVSIDPFTGEAIVYKKLLKGYVVYRLGNDQEDDGGIRNLQHWREGDIPFDVAR